MQLNAIGRYLTRTQRNARSTIQTSHYAAGFNAAKCLTPMTASWSKGNGGRYGYYHCRNSKCRKVKIPKNELEAIFAERLEEVSVAPEMMKLMEEVVREMWAERNKVAQELARKS